jgi:hypothetical protein
MHSLNNILIHYTIHNILEREEEDKVSLTCEVEESVVDGSPSSMQLYY